MAKPAGEQHLSHTVASVIGAARCSVEATPGCWWFCTSGPACKAPGAVAPAYSAARWWECDRVAILCPFRSTWQSGAVCALATQSRAALRTNTSRCGGASPKSSSHATVVGQKRPSCSLIGICHPPGEYSFIEETNHHNLATRLHFSSFPGHHG